MHIYSLQKVFEERNTGQTKLYNTFTKFQVLLAVLVQMTVVFGVLHPIICSACSISDECTVSIFTVTKLTQVQENVFIIYYKVLKELGQSELWAGEGGLFNCTDSRSESYVA
jgi:hypothetical protein